MSCNNGKTNDETKIKQNIFFFNKNIFDLNQKHLKFFQAFRLLKKHKGSKWRQKKT